MPGSPGHNRQRSNGFDLEEHGIGNMKQLTGLVPNLGYNKIDGGTIPYTALDTFWDVDRVEILRGSQGTLYGRNTHASLIKIMTRDPEPEFTADATLNFGSHNTWSAGGALGGLISDTLGVQGGR
ncbi:MAG: hypothetical protein GY737_04200 [Desulfobacteraceae bacterium]|nr:hypothetical protein [Desulfobacteraceae bacterium]